MRRYTEPPEPRSPVITRDSPIGDVQVIWTCGRCVDSGRLIGEDRLVDSRRHWEAMCAGFPDPLGELIRRALRTADDRDGVLEAIVCAQVVASSAVTVVGAGGMFDRYDEQQARHLDALLAGLGDADRLAVVGIASVLEGLLAAEPVSVRFRPPPTRRTGGR
jgi:hypothetical protein